MSQKYQMTKVLKEFYTTEMKINNERGGGEHQPFTKPERCIKQTNSHDKVQKDLSNKGPQRTLHKRNPIRNKGIQLLVKGCALDEFTK